MQEGLGCHLQYTVAKWRLDLFAWWSLGGRLSQPLPRLPCCCWEMQMFGLGEESVASVITQQQNGSTNTRTCALHTEEVGDVHTCRRTQTHTRQIRRPDSVRGKCSVLHAANGLWVIRCEKPRGYTRAPSPLCLRSYLPCSVILPWLSSSPPTGE